MVGEQSAQAVRYCPMYGTAGNVRGQLDDASVNVSQMLAGAVLLLAIGVGDTACGGQSQDADHATDRAVGAEVLQAQGQQGQPGVARPQVPSQAAAEEGDAEGAVDTEAAIPRGKSAPEPEPTADPQRPGASSQTSKTSKSGGAAVS